MGYSGERRYERAIRGPDQLSQPHHLLFHSTIHPPFAWTSSLCLIHKASIPLWAIPSKIVAEAHFPLNFGWGPNHLQLSSMPKHSSFYHYYELRVYADLLSHDFNSALSKFPILSQILTRYYRQLWPNVPVQTKKLHLENTDAKRKKIQNYLKQITIPNYILFSHDKIIFIY
jgi:hypothetical protein